MDRIVSAESLSDLFSLDAMELATVTSVDDTAERRARAEAAELTRAGIDWHVALDHARRPIGAAVASVETLGDAFADLESRVVEVIARRPRAPKPRYSRQQAYAARAR